MCEKIRKYLLKSISIVLIAILLIMNSTIVKSEETDGAEETNPQDPTNNQYLELKAVNIINDPEYSKEDVNYRGSQVIMELRGHNLEFKRF